MGYPATCIYGDPRYYGRFGFRCGEKYEIKTADDEFAVALLVLELDQGVLTNMAGRFIESAAFNVDTNALRNTTPHSRTRRKPGQIRSESSDF
jgi:putative acetyltransferase